MSTEWLGLVAAALWAFTSLISVTPSRHLGAFAYSRWRMGLVSGMLLIGTLLFGSWQGFNLSNASVFMLSGLIGVFIGDTALFACMNRVGPRRASLLFACHAAFSALLGVYLFHEQLSGWRLIGAVTLFSSVALALAFGKRSDGHSWETIQGPVWIGLALGLAAAFCQSIGTVMVKPYVDSQGAGLDPLNASFLRMLAAFAAHLLLYWSGAKVSKSQRAINWRIFGLIACNGFFAMAVGMTLMLYALQHADVSIVALLSSCSPVIVLPLLWAYTRQSPTASAWLSALLCVVGSGLLIYF